MLETTVLDDYQNVAAQFGDWSILSGETNTVVLHDHISEPDELIAKLQHSFAVMCIRERTPFPRSILERLPELRLICNTGMANPSIDLEAATELGILVCGTETSGSAGTAELTWGLILASTRGIVAEDSAVRQGKWQISIGPELQGQTLGLLGLGRIGSQIAAVGRSFGMQVIAWSQNLTAERCAELGVTLVEKNDLFRDSDVLSIHLRLSPRSRGLVSSRELDLMKSTSILINTSRGPIVEEDALIKALSNGTIGGAGLDVFDIEPLPIQHALRYMKNTVITPHLGYVTTQAYTSYFQETIENIKAYLNGNPIRIMNPTVLANESLKAKP